MRPQCSQVVGRTARATEREADLALSTATKTFEVWSRTSAEYRARIMLRAAGITVPDGVQVRVVEDTRELVHFLLPARPAALADGALEQVAGGLPDSFGSIGGHLAAPRPGALSPIFFVSGVVPWK